MTKKNENGQSAKAASAKKMTKEEVLKEIKENRPIYASLAALVLALAECEIEELNPKATPIEVLIGGWKQFYSNAIANGSKNEAELFKAACKSHYYFSIKREPTEELDKFLERTWNTIKVKKY